MKDKDRWIRFEDGTTAIMHRNCRNCGTIVDLTERQFSMQYIQKTLCWECFIKYIEKLFNIKELEKI